MLLNFSVFPVVSSIIYRSVETRKPFLHPCQYDNSYFVCQPEGTKQFTVDCPYSKVVDSCTVILCVDADGRNDKYQKDNVFFMI
jgi:hypothetical protein